MEMKANVASAIKEMMAQMNSATADTAVKKETEKLKTPNNDTESNGDKTVESVKTDIKNVFASQMNEKVIETKDTKEIDPVDSPERDASDDKIEEIHIKEEHEVRKTFGTFIPTPYGKDTRSSIPVSPLEEIHEEKKEEVNIPKPVSYTSSPIVQETKTAAFSITENPSATAYEKTVVANGTVINGNITCQGSMDLSGEVIGNISVNGELKVWGRVQGDIITSNLDVFGGKIKGNITAIDKVNLDASSVVAGSIKAIELSLDGKLKGDVDIEGAVTIGSTGVQIGKITAKQLSIGQGAKLNSTIQMTNADATAIAEEIFA